MYALVPLNDDPNAYDKLRILLAQRYGSDRAPELVTITDEGNIVRMDSAERFYREQLAQQPEMAGIAIRPWDDLLPADRESFAADLGRHIEWLFPDAGPLYYQPTGDILDVIRAPCPPRPT